MSCDDRVDLGVLFVHGIGNQAEGQTLSEFGTPLIEWLKARAEADQLTVTIGRTILSSASEAPARMEATLPAAGQPHRVLFAESWWAESFPVAQFQAVATWSLLIAPWTIGTHFAERLSRARGRRPLDYVAALAALVGALLASPLVLAALALLLLLHWIPLEAVQNALVTVQFAFAGWIGDSYMLVVRPVEAAAIRSRVDRDLDWMLSKCRKVAVVAHSQGAAIAFQVLRQRPSASHLLVTFGSGVRKLEELISARQYGDTLKGALLTVVGLVVAASSTLALPFVVYQVVTGPASPVGIVVVAVAAVLGAALGIAGLQDFANAGEPHQVRMSDFYTAVKDISWLDVYASADPVPNGPLRRGRKKTPKSRCVVNLGSVLFDHTAYWENRDEFVPIVGKALLDFDRGNSIRPPDASFTRFARRQRAARVAMRRSLNWLTALSVAFLIGAFRHDWLTLSGWASHRALGYAVSLVGYTAALVAMPDAGTWARSLGRVVPILALAWVTSRLWHRWNTIVMCDATEGGWRLRAPVAVLTALMVQLAVTGLFVTSAGAAVLVAMAGMILSLCVWVWAGGAFRAAKGVVTLPDKQTTSSAILVLKALWGLSTIAISVGVSGAAILWLGFRLHAYLASRAGDLVAWVVVAALVVAAARLASKRNAASF